MKKKYVFSFSPLRDIDGRPEKTIAKHYGPGPHENGTLQEVHGQREGAGDDDKRYGASQRRSSFVYPDGKPMNRTHIGAVYEELLLSHIPDSARRRISGLTGDRFHYAGKGHHSAHVDVLVGEFAIEVKTVNSNAKSQKATMKGYEIKHKYETARELKRRPATVVQVVNQRSHRVGVYFFPDEYAARIVRKKAPSWTYTYTDSDFVVAMDRQDLHEK